MIALEKKASNGPLHIEVRRTLRPEGGYNQPEIHMWLDECPADMWHWTWPYWDKDRGPSVAEEFARTLAAVDPTFEVRHLNH